MIERRYKTEEKIADHMLFTGQMKGLISPRVCMLPAIVYLLFGLFSAFCSLSL